MILAIAGYHAILDRLFGRVVTACAWFAAVLSSER